ncbi:rhodanese-like domain-containing protein [Pseudonocardia sp. TRM90224]|uniref:rhodanese-like domain-containing protein n=1 Tax=Pseudonocardia sp. TRM90224 TaxID=2812678 RepID=UPI001E44EDA8|nr:rhodanese-like domain-containing protein [Pseudonocardia sp. TRM90224]
MTGPAVPSVSVAELPADAVLLDVREGDEWAAGHAPDAQHIPMSELTGRLHELPEDADPLYIVCRSGGRSGRVVAFLSQQGHPVVNVDGGMQAWEAMGKPLVGERDGVPPVVI